MRFPASLEISGVPLHGDCSLMTSLDDGGYGEWRRHGEVEQEERIRSRELAERESRELALDLEERENGDDGDDGGAASSNGGGGNEQTTVTESDTEDSDLRWEREQRFVERRRKDGGAACEIPDGDGGKEMSAEEEIGPEKMSLAGEDDRRRRKRLTGEERNWTNQRRGVIPVTGTSC